MTMLLLRADAGPAIGVGHLSRCVALAEAALSRGWRVALCGDVGSAGWLAGNLPVLPAGDLAEQAKGADAVFVDHYGLGELPAIRDVTTLVSIEDGQFGRRAADVVVDANLTSAPRPVDGSPVVLTGPRYAPLRAEVRSARAARQAGGSPPNVVVVMGGGAAGEPVAAALTALRDTGVPMNVRAISSAVVPVPDAAPGQRLTVEGPTTGLPALFASADLVVSAAGVTLLELCCIGVPTALVQLADNQAAGYAAALERGLAAGLGTDPRRSTETLRALLLDADRRAALAATARSTVDGWGASRILDAIAPEPSVRAATEADAELLLAWRNDAETRAWSRDGDPIGPADHRAWLRRVLADRDRRLLVAELADRPVGTVRFDRAGGGEWEVSITVAPTHRGRGLAGRILTAGERALRATVTVDTILANVHRDNLASRALFDSAGYAEQAQRPADGPFVWLAKPLATPSRE